MKLKKHLKLFVQVLLKIISREEIITRDDDNYKRKIVHKRQLKDVLNKEVNDERLSINSRQLSKVIREQKKYCYETNGNYYIFREREDEEKRNLYK